MMGRFPSWRSLAHAVAIPCLSLLLGCQRPELAYDTQQPRTAAVRNIGNFNQALRCMDDMFVAQGKRDVYITTAGIPDATGLIAAGTKEMFISAVSRMSAKSSAFRFVDYDPTQLDVQILSELVGLREDFVAPNYYIRGAITQLDSSVLRSSAGGGISIPFMDLAASADQVVSVVSVDLNIGKLTTRQILSGISANNSMAVTQSSKGADVGGLIGKAGLSFSISLDKSEGFHQAVRNLIELSTIEVLGKLTRVPYWQCLSIESTNPNFRTEAREWFDTMTGSERTQFVQANLMRAGYMQSGSGGDLSGAISRYQAEHDLVPSGRIDFDLYYRLLASDSRQGGRPAQATQAVAAAQPAPATPVVPSASVASATAGAVPEEAPRLTLTTTRGQNATYRVGDTLSLRLQPTRDAYVYCYYQDAGGTVARIFPNRFQPDAFISGRTQMVVPPNGQTAFDIRFDRAGGREAVACFAADREVGLLLPNDMKVQDLTPIPVRNLDDVVARFHQIPRARVADAAVVVEVAR